MHIQHTPHQLCPPPTPTCEDDEDKDKAEKQIALGPGECISLRAWEWLKDVDAQDASHTVNRANNQIALALGFSFLIPFSSRKP
ncbi:hypothetical protein TARUN_333 [Trichoderma arundinaceum]|uniref:Uncharacterized protein n=1 Tax=Trichoderma arundinaceum TaxID=490622 RepID=A0A395P0J6_TRIAR|nr:hypothetical protein TARUN_333 [Trichoderma arundinaceum]